MHQICTQAHLIYKNQGFRESDALLWGLANILNEKAGDRKQEREEKRRENIKSKPRAENPNEELSVNRT
ncbi:hypothetical protein BCT31_10835 [Vibrio lentus]|nr:hypothetical protein BCT31_10835 [Vibrio lentus]